MLNRPPYGAVRLLATEPVGCILWEPGNGSRYCLHAVDVGEQVAEALGGRIMVSLSSMADGTFVTHALHPEMVGHWTREYVRRKWQRIHGIGDHVEHLAMLLNWTLGGERARAYAEELWRKVYSEDGKVVSLHARRIHRRQGGNP